MNGLPFLLSSIALATLAGCAESGITLASDPALLAQAQAGAGGLGVGAANAYVNHKLSQQKDPPPEKKDS